MKAAVAALVLLALGAVNGQSYGGITYKYNADIKAQNSDDIASTSGSTRVSTTDRDTLYFYSSLVGGVDITAVQIHVSPTPGASNGGPLLLALTNTTGSPLNSPAGGPLIQSGTRTTANLLASPMLAAARAKVAELGVTDNSLQNIGDVERLLARGLCYSDVHSVTRPPPRRVGSGLFFQLPPAGRKLSSFF